MRALLEKKKMQACGCVFVSLMLPSQLSCRANHLKNLVANVR